MAIYYSTNLKIAIPDTGTPNWGALANNNLGDQSTNASGILEQAVSGYFVLTMTGSMAITIPNGYDNSSPYAIARNMYIECQGSLSSPATLTVPTNKKLYFIYNNTGQALTVTTGSSGVTIPTGSRICLACNGTAIVPAINYIANFSTNAIDNTPIGANTPSTGAFTTLNASSLTVSGATVLNGTTIPGSVTLVDTSSTQSISGKTLTSPTINTASIVGGTMQGVTIQGDTIENSTIGQSTPTKAKFTQAYTGAVSISPSTSAASIDCSTGNVFYMTLAASASINTLTFTNQGDGQTINIFVTQPASGTAATMYTSWAKWPGGAPSPLLSTTSSAVDLIVATYRGTTWYATVAKAFA